jgi:DNA-binding HxlR family transcriptional regulator
VDTSRNYTCGLDAAVDVMGGKWKALILWALHFETLRFGQLRRELPGISERVLSLQLKEMQADGLVHREMYPEVPPKVEYSLTDLGHSLTEALMPLGDWGERHIIQVDGRVKRQ